MEGRTMTMISQVRASMLDAGSLLDLEGDGYATAPDLPGNEHYDVFHYEYVQVGDVRPIPGDDWTHVDTEYGTFTFPNDHLLKVVN